jgi:hypothetical protein
MGKNVYLLPAVPLLVNCSHSDQDFWVGGAQNSGFFNLSCTYDKPVLIGEIGWHQINDEQNNANPDWFNRIVCALRPCRSVAVVTAFALCICTCTCIATSASAFTSLFVQWMDLVLNIDQGCIGGVFFEYNDEPLKSSIDQRTMGIVKFSVCLRPAPLYIRFIGTSLCSFRYAVPVQNEFAPSLP